jgi:uncharacterized protein YbjT (DUF2867 family)
MTIDVIGGSGLIGTKVVNRLTAHADAENQAGVRHEVALSVAGADRQPDRG